MWRRFLVVMLVVAGCDSMEGCSPPPNPGITPSPAATATAAAATVTGTATGTPRASATAAGAVPTPTPTPTPSPSPTPSPTEPPALTAILDYLVEVGVLELITAQGYMNEYQTDPLGDLEHATGEEPGYTPDLIELIGHGGFLVDLDENRADALDAALPCQGNLPDGFRTWCGSNRMARAGSWVMVTMVHSGTLDMVDPQDNALFTHALVTDPGGDPTNNFQALPDFPGDSYQNSSRWYEFLQRDDQQAVWVTDIPPTGEIDRGNSDSDGRMLIVDDAASGHREVGFFIPASEFGDSYRVVSIAAKNSSYEPENSGHDFSDGLEQLLDLLPCGGLCTKFGQ